MAVSDCRPIVTFLREVDGDRPCAGKVYHRFYSLMEHVKNLQGVSQAKKDQILPKIEERWNQGHSDMHAAGYALDPEFTSHDYSGNEEVGWT